MVEYTSRTSRYRNTPNSEDNVAQEDDLFILPDNTDTAITVTGEMRGRPDLIAYEAYKNPLLGWIIMRRNNIMKAEDIVLGMRLFVPSVQRVYEIGGIIEP